MAITEFEGIERQGVEVSCGHADGVRTVLSNDTPVSMNLWAFQPEFFKQLGDGFAAFLGRHGQSADREFYLPGIINDLLQSQRAKVRVLPARDNWCGITHAEDKDGVCRRIHQLVTSGHYPAPLWA